MYTLQLDLITEFCSNYYKVLTRDLVCTTRRIELVSCRFVIWNIAYYEFKIPTKFIGEYFNSERTNVSRSTKIGLQYWFENHNVDYENVSRSCVIHVNNVIHKRRKQKPRFNPTYFDNSYKFIC